MLRTASFLRATALASAGSLASVCAAAAALGLALPACGSSSSPTGFPSGGGGGGASDGGGGGSTS
ncbi:MAG TPA: hypothetical protein VIY73_00350, partial [Polyangiaceae bacterium]